METSSLIPPTSSPHDSSILVVDDEPSVLAVAQAILQTIGQSPATADNGEDARRWLETRVAQGKTVHLIILDLTMPGGPSGFETLEALRAIHPEVPVIACSGYFQDSARELCRGLGFTDILSKPYRPEALLRIVRHHLLEAPPSSLADEERWPSKPQPVLH
ncbi:MAG: response regulator [Verrucomicrobiales bacterium]|nr:response regulator [Verrucomicrobiales bacterium]